MFDHQNYRMPENEIRNYFIFTMPSYGRIFFSQFEKNGDDSAMMIGSIITIDE